jgi:anti-anti-sigma factor
MPLTIDVDKREAVTVAAVGGELDLATAPELFETVSSRISAGDRHIVLDLSGLTFCDSAGLSLFVRLQRQLEELGGDLTLAAPTPIVRRVLDVTGLAAAFGSHDSVDESVAAAAVRAAAAARPVNGGSG